MRRPTFPAPEIVLSRRHEALASRPTVLAQILNARCNAGKIERSRSSNRGRKTRDVRRALDACPAGSLQLAFSPSIMAFPQVSLLYKSQNPSLKTAYFFSSTPACWIRSPTDRSSSSILPPISSILARMESDIVWKRVCCGRRTRVQIQSTAEATGQHSERTIWLRRFWTCVSINNQRGEWSE